jgi:hypothetical protein
MPATLAECLRRVVDCSNLCFLGDLCVSAVKECRSLVDQEELLTSEGDQDGESREIFDFVPEL